MSGLASDLLEIEYFFDEDCIVTSSGDVLGFRQSGNSLIVEGKIDLSKASLTSLGIMKKIDLNDQTHVGGEGVGHGSMGFFYKKSGNVLKYALFSTMSDPFVGIDFDAGKDCVYYVSSSGKKWTVYNDDISSVFIL